MTIHDINCSCHSPVSKSNNLLIDILDKRLESLHAILLRASWHKTCVRHVSRPDSMSRSWTACLQVRHSISLIKLSWQNMRELACNLVMGFLALNLCEVWLNIRQCVSKLNKHYSKSDILAHWLSWQNMRELAGNLVTSVLAVIVCEVCLNIRQYVLKLDSLSQSWTICSLVFLTKDQRACMQS